MKSEGEAAGGGDSSVSSRGRPGAPPRVQQNSEPGGGTASGEFQPGPRRRLAVKRVLRTTAAKEGSNFRKWVEEVRPRNARDCVSLAALNVFAFVVAGVAGVFTFESSTSDLRNSVSETVVFPMYIPHAVSLAIACKYVWPTFPGNFAGFYATRVYSAWRGGYLTAGNAGTLLAAAVLGAAEVATAAFVLRRLLCGRRTGRKTPTIETIHEAVEFVVTVFSTSFVFDAFIALLICSSPDIAWSDFSRFWSASWMGVLAAKLTVAPFAMHFLAWRPRPSLLRPGKVLEALVLTGITTALVVIMFIADVHAVIRPLPYLLFPVIILSAFRFNRLGCAFSVMIICYVCSWASVRGKGAVYKMAGSPLPYSSPRLVLQVELFVSVLGLVGILLAAAVREKKQLARDLHTMNEFLETKVTQRTLQLVTANDELKESQKRAEDASQAKSDFLANMSHEIRTPIHGIMGLTAILLDSELSTDQTDSLLSVKECANLLLHIINSILDLAKIEAGRVELEFVPFNVRRLVSTTVRMLTTRAQERQVELLWEVDSTVPEWMVGDSGKIQQCLLNLVGNAVKFTHEGSVTVHVTRDAVNGLLESTVPELTNASQGMKDPPLLQTIDSTAITIFDKPMAWKSDLEARNGHNLQTVPSGTTDVTQKSDSGYPILFKVCDTGIGISSTKLADIFTPFTQADASISRIYGGTGLGLCIVQRFVELLGGELLAESEEGKGSTFKFSIPLQSSDDQRADVEDAAGSIEKPKFSPQIPDTHVSNTGGADPADLSLPSLNSDRRDADQTRLTAEPDINIVNLESNPQGCSQVEFYQGSDIIPDGGTIDTRGGGTQSLKSIDPWDSVILCEWNESSNEDQENKSREPNCSSTSGECKTVGVDSSPPHSSTSKAELGTSQSPSGGQQQQEQPGLVQQPRPPFFAKDTSLRCSVTVQTDNRNSRDEEGQSSPQSVRNVVDANLLSSQTRKETVRKLGIPKAEAGSVQHSLQGSTHGGRTSPHTDAGEPKNLRKLRVLLAEDNLINQKIAIKQLQKHGHVVTVVGDGVGALDSVIAGHDSYDLVLMDVQMPNMDGLEATKRIREEELQRHWTRIPVLGLTAHAIQGYESICLSSGMDGYLGKPFDIKQLLVVMNRYLPTFKT